VTLDNVHKRLLDNLKTGVVLLDKQLRLLYINVAAESLLDISDRKAQGLFIGELLVDAEEDIKDIQTAMLNKTSFTRRRAELSLVHGKLLFVDFTISPFEEQGEPQAMLELYSLEHTHRISREQSLHQARETTRELVRGLAHEIKNPLGGIRGAAQLLASEIDAAHLTEYTSVIIAEADRLHNLVDRMMGSRKPLEIKTLNIHEVLERVRSLVQVEAADSGIQLVKDYDPSIPLVEADKEQLIQALLNIVRNALQALSEQKSRGRPGKILLRSRVLRNVTVGACFHRLAACVEVIDNGPGVPPELIETMFYPMISGRPNGSGLGLPITHGIINQHKGLIECESKPGRTRFSIVLPLAAVESAET